MFRTALFTLLLTITLTHPVFAQVVYDPLLNLVCYDEVIYPTPASLGKLTQTNGGWETACRSLDICVAAGGEASICQLRLAADLLAHCTNDALCQAQAFVYAAGVNAVFDNGFFIALDNVSTVEALQQGLFHIEEGLPLEARDAFLQHDADVPMLLLSAAAALRAEAGLRTGESDAFSVAESAALIARAQALLPAHPLINYVAALVLGESGDTTRASHLTYTLNVTLKDEIALQPLLAALRTTYPLDVTRFEPWLLYEVYLVGGGPGGSTYRDLHAERPIPVRVLREDDGSLTIIDYPFEEELLGVHPEAYIAYFPADTMQTGYRSTDISTTLERRTTDSGYVISEQYSGFEFSVLTVQQLLVPAGSGDPVAGLQPIDCGLLHWFSAGQTVQSTVLMDMLSVFDQPGGTEVARLYSVVLTEENRCEGSTLWWRVQFRDTEGGRRAWLPINEGDYISLWVDLGLNYPVLWD